jgi:hypothetical protein
MQVLMLYADSDTQSREIGGEMEQFLRDYDVETYHRISDLVTRFATPGSWEMILICIVSQTSALRELEAFREKYPDACLMLLIPDQEEETLWLAHKLAPSFIAHLEDDIKDVKAVMLKMLKSKVKGEGD